MKALILAAGRGSRLNEVTHECNKSMMRIGDRELIKIILDEAVEIDLSEMVLVVGYRAEDLINSLGNRYRDVKIKYVIQREQKGLVHALECAEPFIEGEDFFLFLGDEILLNNRRREMIELYNTSGCMAVCGLVRRPKESQSLIRRTYGLIMDTDMRIIRLIEKPRKILNHWQGLGNCVMRSEIFDYINVCPIHHERKEKEFPDLIQCAIDDGKAVYGFDVCDDYVNINSQDDIDYLNSIVAN